MNKVNSSNTPWLALTVGALTTIAWLLLTWRYGFDIADEGFYWYGAQRMLHGEIPMRDFMAYDLGRYAWSAAVMWLCGDQGIAVARLGAGLFQVCTIPVGVLLVLQACQQDMATWRKIACAVLASVVLNLWVYPYYKVFDYGTSILIVAMLVLMLRSQSSRHWFYAGLILGASAVMGRNHGVYGAVAALALLAILAVRQRDRGLLAPAGAYIAGTVAGFSPTFLIAMFAEGFGPAFVATIREMIGSGATNIGLPVPWPWTYSAAELGWVYWAFNAFKGFGFIALLAVPVLALLACLRKPLARYTPADVLILCAALAAIPYAHYAYSRADLIHLALAIVPLLLVLLGLGSALKRPVLASLMLVGLSVLTLTLEKPQLSNLVFGKPLASISINGSTLKVFPGEEAILQDFDRVLAAAPEARANFLAVPAAPGIYAIHQERMPIWEIYSLWARDPAFEEAELARLRARPPRLVMLSDHALDGNETLRYSQTHPLIYRWILSNYRRVGPLSATNGNAYQIYAPLAPQGPQ
ncbi:hypothetical protein [Massilia sp. IC2-476]|uniref:hypothetical protein n=1 Tax=Massilia sp. IC2-476 TaxID=2887199 RepID=UPI001D12691F|nr:hypothetical protein [Massilia sp. IC2-476]MCC2970838.1 hypothetical protein [Massilia sp. IC2-476]